MIKYFIQGGNYGTYNFLHIFYFRHTYSLGRTFIFIDILNEVKESRNSNNSRY